MFIVFDKVTRAPYDKDGHGHFKFYATRVAARRYIGTHLKHRCEVRRAAYHVYAGAVHND